jgi:gliding motility-associated-like protein
MTPMTVRSLPYADRSALALVLFLGICSPIPLLSQCGENIVMNAGFEDVGPPCGVVPAGGLINAAFNTDCVPGWQASWGTPSVCAFDVFAGNHVACFGTNNEGMFQSLSFPQDTCGSYTLTFWYRGIKGFWGSLHVYLANGLVNVPGSHSGWNPFIALPAWQFVHGVNVNDDKWHKATVTGLVPVDPANTQLLFQNYPGYLDVAVDEVFLGIDAWDAADIGFSIEQEHQSGTTFTFTAEIANPPAGLDPSSITWDFGDGAMTAGEQVTHAFPEIGLYVVCASVAKSCGCVTSVCVDIDACAFNALEATVQVDDETCLGAADGAIRLTGITGGTGPYQVGLDGGPMVAGGLGDWPVFDQLAAGAYTVIAEDANGCRDTVVGLDIRPGSSIVANAGPDLEGLEGGVIDLLGQSIPSAAQWTWHAIDSLFCATCPTVRLGPLTTSQWVVLEVRNNDGCSDTDSIRIELRSIDYSRIVPNVFSPNGDGVNDVFTFSTSIPGTRLLKFEIYDRWGGLLYRLGSPLDLADFPGWDGTVAGALTGPGVYVYLIELIPPSTSGDAIRLAGDVNLLR